jgi:eukaryotic translation initiation factor 2C
MPLGGGLEAWKGFSSSVRPTFKQLMVNVNVFTAAFYTPGNLALALDSFMKHTSNARPNDFVEWVRVKTTHLGDRRKVKRVTAYTASEYIFDSEFGKVTMEQYFKQSKVPFFILQSTPQPSRCIEYKITLRFPDMPLVDVGGAEIPPYLPSEVCEILPGQAFRRKLSDENTAEMIRAACNLPHINADFIMGRGIEKLGFKGPAPPLEALGISIGPQMTVVSGRILRPPGIIYRQGTPVVDERARWNLRDVKFAKGGDLKRWAVLVIKDGCQDEFEGPDDPQLRNLVTDFAIMCRRSGMNVDDAIPQYDAVHLPPKKPEDPIRAQSISAIREVLRKFSPKPTLVLIILANGDKHVYSAIKHICDSYLDIATICAQTSKIRKEHGRLQYFANLALKINMKMGGVNHALDPTSMHWLKQSPTMLVGMHVTHPDPGIFKGIPSIAAVVASVDHNFAQYPASLRMQETNNEVRMSVLPICFPW